jgi:peptide/nickel transport system substrate-binding protein
VAARAVTQHRGGTLRLLHTQPLAIDPAVNADILPLQSDALTRDGLLTYRHVPGPAGTQLVPDLATNLPTPTDGGTTYTFRLRPGVRYSDGRSVRAGDFRRAIERTLRQRTSNGDAYTGIVRVASCTATSCDLTRGIVTDEQTRTVTFHLREPDPDFPASLAAAAASAVPSGTPFTDVGVKPIPGTGPYKIASASSREVRYVRNPFFHEWSHAARPDGNPDAIVMRFGLSADDAVRAVEAGRADWSADNVPADAIPALRTRHPSQLHSFTIPTTDFVQFNTHRQPFDDLRVRRALNFALDRRRIAQLYGGSALATPTCQVLPAGLPGYRRYCPYNGPDLSRARRLVAGSGTRGQPVTVWSWTDDPTITPAVGRYIAGVLRRLGYRTRLQLVSHASLEHASATVLRRIQLLLAAWGDTPSGFFSTNLACRAPLSHGWFCDLAADRLMRRAQALKATQPRAAAALWAQIDHRLVDRAAWAPMINEHGLDFVSARVRNYQSHPYWGLIADQTWLR